MGQNFLTCDRDQPLLLPPDLHDWLEEDHLAWFVIQSIEELDLDAFYASYRADGHGRAAHDPKMMLTLLTYAYCVGERSSRGIERRCREDVALPGDLRQPGARPRHDRPLQGAPRAGAGRHLQPGARALRPGRARADRRAGGRRLQVRRRRLR